MGTAHRPTIDSKPALEADSTAIDGCRGLLHRQAEADKAQRDAQWQAVKDKPRTPRADRPRRERKRPTDPPVGTGYAEIEPTSGWIPTADGWHLATIEWATLYDVARHYAKKAKAQDTGDLLHDIVLGLAQVYARKQAKAEPFSLGAMHRTAEHLKDRYWHTHYAYTNGLDCRHCSTEQKGKCRYNWAHSDFAYADCHRAIQLESLNAPITDSEGNMTELGDLIADDTATDLDAWLDARTWLIGAPVRLKRIVKAMHDGEPLGHRDRDYLYKLRRKSQKSLF